MAVRKRITASGRVQGVWFRGSTRDRAQSLGVAGWAENRADGSVEVVAEGEPDAVDSLLSFVRRGPRGAEVRDVEVVDEDPEGLSGFDVR